MDKEIEAQKGTEIIYLPMASVWKMWHLYPGSHNQVFFNELLKTVRRIKIYFYVFGNIFPGTNGL